MIEIFRTNVPAPHEAQQALQVLALALPDHAFNFDLEDCDRILRAETITGNIAVTEICRVLAFLGYEICILPD